MQDQATADRTFEWLDHVQPVGLVLARSLLKSLGLQPERQGRNEEEIVAEFLNADEGKPALKDPWAFFEGVLGWQAVNVAGAPGGSQLDGSLTVSVAEYDTALAPSWAVRGVKGEPHSQLLVRIEDAGTDPDRRAALKGWEATPHQRFERLLRDTEVHAGVLVTDRELRLIYAPRGETSGWIAFPLRHLGTVAGRSMLGGLKLALGSFRLFNDSPERRLPALLRHSREAQATVSTHLSAQVLGALYELLRGLHAADPKLVSDLAQRHPQQLYEGLLTMLMRLVFVLYAEDRDLIPSHTDGRAKALYEQGYSIRGLFEKLSEDEARYPDTMNERVGGWGRLLALFRLVHSGHKSGWIKGRGGKLFNPDVHPFLEGRAAKDDPPRILSLSDGALLRILRGLLIVDGERLSYRTLDVEQVGSVYETVMGFTVMLAGGPSIAIKAGKNNKTPVFVDLGALLPLKPAARMKDIKENTGRKLTGQVETKVKQAKSVEELGAAFDSIVDERGSPARRTTTANMPILQPTNERRRTGSHYTPRSLTEPIVRHALEPAFERIGENAKPEDVLALRVCDPAMGSGAFLVEACRILAARLVKAWAQWPETKPTIPPDEDEELHARRLVAQRCLYGVDKNPMATDLAKLSLWLATLARDHEFEFVDHALKTGDSLVGLTNAQIAAANWDDSAQTLFTKQIREKVKAALKIRDEIRDAPDGEFSFVQERRNESFNRQISEPRLIGDAVISAFFADGKPRAREQQRMHIEGLVAAPGGINVKGLDEAAARLRRGDHPIRPFHWQLEFPEVFEGKNPGFDAIVGNPPFLGGTSISGALGDGYLAYLKSNSVDAGNRTDLVAYFFQRAFSLLNSEGASGLVSTNTIFQGDTRVAGPLLLRKRGGQIFRCRKRLAWPGDAAVVVSVLHFARNNSVSRSSWIDERKVRLINSFLLPSDYDGTPARLAACRSKSFKGLDIYGAGFLFDDFDDGANSKSIMENIVIKNPEAMKRIAAYIGGEEVNASPTHNPTRYLYDLNDLTEEGAWTEQPELMALAAERVKPQRDKLRDNADGRRLKENWWRFNRTRDGLFSRIQGLSKVLVVCRVSPHLSVALVDAHHKFSDSLIVFTFEGAAPFTILQSRPHEVWTRFLASSLRDDLRYTPSDCFETFAFPPAFDSNMEVVTIGQAYLDYRAQLMVARKEGLTKTYNRFHNPNESSTDIAKLRQLHDAMDQAVLKAYGWNDLADRISSDPDAGPRHLADNEDEHQYQGRYFWPAPIRDEILARLLALNAERADAERRAGVTSAIATGEDDQEVDEEGGEDGNPDDEDEDA